MRDRISSSIDGVVSGINRNIKTMVDRSIDTEQDIKSRQPSFFRDDLWRFGAFQLSNFLDSNNTAMFGRDNGKTVGH